MGTVYCVNNYVLLSSMKPSHHNITTSSSPQVQLPSPPPLHPLYTHCIIIFAYSHIFGHYYTQNAPNDQTQPNCSICQTHIHPSSRTDHIFNQCSPRKLCCTPTSHKIAKTNPLKNPTTNRLYPYCNAKTDFLYIFNI